MTFIGIISDYKSFEKIEEHFLDKKLDISLIHINKNSIPNMKNIKFETILIDSNLKEFDREKRIIEQISSNAKYLIINTDMNAKSDLDAHIKEKMITYGLNQKSVVTVSSITDTGILICLQKNIINIKNNICEVGEQLIKLKEKTKLKLYEILIIFIISTLYDYPIIDEI